MSSLNASDQVVVPKKLHENEVNWALVWSLTFHTAMISALAVAIIQWGSLSLAHMAALWVAMWQNIDTPFGTHSIAHNGIRTIKERVTSLLTAWSTGMGFVHWVSHHILRHHGRGEEPLGAQVSDTRNPEASLSEWLGYAFFTWGPSMLIEPLGEMLRKVLRLHHHKMEFMSDQWEVVEVKIWETMAELAMYSAPIAYMGTLYLTGNKLLAAWLLAYYLLPSQFTKWVNYASHKMSWEHKEYPIFGYSKLGTNYLNPDYIMRFWALWLHWFHHLWNLDSEDVAANIPKLIDLLHKINNDHNANAKLKEYVKWMLWEISCSITIERDKSIPFWSGKYSSGGLWNMTYKKLANLSGNEAVYTKYTEGKYWKAYMDNLQKSIDWLKQVFQNWMSSGERKKLLTEWENEGPAWWHNSPRELLSSRFFASMWDTKRHMGISIDSHTYTFSMRDSCGLSEEELRLLGLVPYHFKKIETNTSI